MSFVPTVEQRSQFERMLMSNLDSLGLRDWDVRVVWLEFDAPIIAPSVDAYNRVAVFSMAPVWENGPEPNTVERIAYRAALTVMLAQIRWLAGQDYICGEVKKALVTMESNAIIRRLENLYMGGM